MWGCNEAHSTNLKEAHETGSWLKTKKVGEEEDGWAAVRPSLVQWARPKSAVYFESNGEPLKTFKKVRDIIRSVTRKSHHADFGEENGMGKRPAAGCERGWASDGMRDDGGLNWWGSGGQHLSKNLTAYLPQSRLNSLLVSPALNSCGLQSLDSWAPIWKDPGESVCTYNHISAAYLSFGFFQNFTSFFELP